VPWHEIKPSVDDVPLFAATYKITKMKIINKILPNKNREMKEDRGIVSWLCHRWHIYINNKTSYH
jgi:hypothetical protein